MMNQGIGSILDSINQALLQYVSAEQVEPVMQQISQALAPLGGTQNQPRPIQQPMVSPLNFDASDAFSGPTPLADVFNSNGGSMTNHPASGGGFPLPTFGVTGTTYGIGSLLK